MNDLWIGVIATTVGAALGLIGGGLIAWTQLRVHRAQLQTQWEQSRIDERERWQRACVDTRQQTLIAEVKEFASVAAALTQRMNWIVWMAIEAPGELRSRHFDAYDELAKTTVERLMASAAAVALLDVAVYERLNLVQVSIERADLLLARAGERFRNADDAWQPMLRTSYPDLLEVHRYISASLATPPVCSRCS